MPRAAVARPAPAATPVPAVEAAEPAISERVERPAPAAPAYVRGTSQLGERARAEYHYVTRDLRNIGVLVVVIAVLLAVAVIAFNALGLV